jgi:hypothetical protein
VLAVLNHATAPTGDAAKGEMTTTKDRARKRVWIYSDTGMTATPVTLGLTDGQLTELVEGDLAPGSVVVTSVSTAAEPTRAAASSNMFMPGGGMGGPGGGAGGGARTGTRGAR